MNTKHTPGPWQYDGMWSLIMAGKYEIAAIHAARFAEETSRRKRLDEVQANARLIAAAPELLEACKRALSAIEALPPRLNEDRYEPMMLLSRAIAKATGDSIPAK